jgi:hypothetical protein
MRSKHEVVPAPRGRRWRNRLRSSLLASALAVPLGSAGAARADKPVDTFEAGRKLQPVTHVPSERAWAVGVPEKQQLQARELFKEGNALLKESFFAPAAGKYREALALWKHPGIHYNLALALINLDRPIEVREHLVAALRYGTAPLDQEKFNHAQSYLKLIEKQLAPIEITCAMDGAVVTLDDRQLFRAPGRYEGFVLPGEHRIRANKLGYEPTEYKRTLLPGKPTKLDLKLYTEEQLVRHKRRWPFWGPVVVTAAGAAALGAGGILLSQSNAKLEDYDRRVEDECSSGCEKMPSDLADLRDTGKAYRAVSTVTLIGGGLVLTGGVVLMVLNRAVPYRINPEGTDRGIAFEPVIGTKSGGIVGVGRF